MFAQKVLHDVMAYAVFHGVGQCLSQWLPCLDSPLRVVDEVAVVPKGLVLQEPATFAYIFIIADIEAGDNQFQRGSKGDVLWEGFGEAERGFQGLVFGTAVELVEFRDGERDAFFREKVGASQQLAVEQSDIDQHAQRDVLVQGALRFLQNHVTFAGKVGDVISGQGEEDMFQCVDGDLLGRDMDAGDMPVQTGQMGRGGKVAAENGVFVGALWLGVIHCDSLPFLEYMFGIIIS